MRNHPHGRGEDITLTNKGDYVQGTPPRAWGRLLCFNVLGLYIRNTPTGVGKTTRSGAPRGASRNHPHGRGEDFCIVRSATALLETPPRAWGRPLVVELGRLEKRNTPTGVGKTCQKLLKIAIIEKHPHGRGEDRSARVRAWVVSETPPRAWGRPTSVYFWRGVFGNTPTGVGKTGFSTTEFARCWKHPHGRGEDEAWKAKIFYPSETPPRAWGRQWLDL